eukprot:4660324-Prymnesium_polylepis.1
MRRLEVSPRVRPVPILWNRRAAAAAEPPTPPPRWPGARRDGGDPRARAVPQQGRARHGRP